MIFSQNPYFQLFVAMAITMNSSGSNLEPLGSFRVFTSDCEYIFFTFNFKVFVNIISKNCYILELQFSVMCCHGNGSGTLTHHQHTIKQADPKS